MSNYVYKDDCEVEVLACSSKNGAIGQNVFIVSRLARLSVIQIWYTHSIAFVLESLTC